MDLKRISKKEAHDKYGICISGANSLCKYFLRGDGCVVDDTGCIRYYPPMKANIGITGDH